MARRAARLLASLATLQAAASPNSFLTEDRPLRLAEPLSAAVDNSGRGLQAVEDLCYFNLLNVFENAKMNDWQKCINNEAKTKNFSVAGATAEMNVECWCQENMEAVLTDYGCCKPGAAYQEYCKAICPPLNDTCSAAEAQTCIQNCPALCYEKDYAPSFCDSSCTNCEKYILCITRHSENRTHAGHPSNPQICDDTEFYNSQEWKDWFDCYSKYPKRTHWARYNAENFCYCNASLKAAAQRFSCCNADWGQTICDDDCSTIPDCLSTEAQTCLNDCKQTCERIYSSQMTEDCRNQCMDASATCEKYRVCEPAGPFAFDYVCDDGNAPNVRGCCRGSYGNPVCPKLCTSATGHHPTLEAVNVLLTNTNLECSCQGCPSNVEQTKAKYKETLDENLFKTGNLEIARIAKEYGLIGPNRRMQELLQERDERITTEFNAHQGLPDDTWQATMDAIIAEYTPLFRAEAERYARDGDPTVAPVVVESSDDDDGGIILIIIIAAGVVVIILLVAVVYVLYSRGKARSAMQGGQRPRDGDPNVVMGRPVAPGAETQVTEGAPVEVGDKGAEDNSNAKI